MQKQTIALIDDDRNILTSLSIALEKEGFKVQTYIDGESALIGLTRTPPDLAIVDIKMPKMDGEELLKKLRKKTSLPVIFLTSKDDEIDELLGLKLGADDFVKKSGGFSIKVLIERIRVQLRKKESKDSIEENKSGGMYIYRSSKTGLNQVVKSLSIDLKAYGITVVALHPGWVKTDMGGPNAPVSIDESVEGMIRVIDTTDIKDTGKFLNYDGRELPW